MTGDILYDPNRLFNLFVYGLAIFYLAEAFVDIVKHIRFPYNRYTHLMPGTLQFDTTNSPLYIYFLNFRPFNCQFCMTGWLAIGFYLLNIQMEYFVPFAVAGLAVIVWKIKYRLETIIA